jgi:asparagine synthase (glutamine-hydrolysing)
VTGRETLYKRLYQLQAGEVLIWDKRGKGLERDRYYLFYSEITRGEKEEVLIEELDEITNSIFRRVIEESGGAPIWVPLSGGLDSRLVLCKLKQLGHDDLHAFSYGPLHNYDAKWAKHVAEKVGVPWVYVPYRKGAIKNFFFSKTRRDYWEFSGEYSSLPFMVDEFAVSVLKAKKLVSENAIFLNGQSGDFISGGHAHGTHLGMLEEDIQYPASTITRAIVKKHLSQNRLLLQDVNLARISGKITSLLGIHDGELNSRDQVIKLYEWWEWQERQSKFVVNGQRSYDFFGHSWFLPLWGDEYLRFWKELGYEHKLKESLYKAYLERFDFYGVFRGFKPNLWNWQGVSMVILPIGWGVRKVFGDGVADSFYHHLSYFGKYQNHYAPFGFRKWVNRARDLKSPLALYVETWIEDNGMAA